MITTKHKLPASIATLGATLFFLGASAYAATPTPFTTLVPHPNGLAASLTNIFATSQDNNTIYMIDATGTSVTPFATLPVSHSMPMEIYLAISPGLGGFTANNLFACVSNQVYQITPGRVVSLFKDFSSPEGITSSTLQHCGITFDKVGTFQNSLIVTLQVGKVFKLNSSGAATLVAGPAVNGLAADITEGPEVTPASFLPAPSMLIVTQENQGNIWQIDGSGNVTLFKGNVNMPESNHMVPLTVCNFASSGGAFFSTDDATGTIYKYPMTDFSTILGDLLVPLEFFGGIAQFDKTTGAATMFDTLAVVHEGSTFVQCQQAPPPPPTRNCTLTWGGYANHFNNLVTPLTLGSVSYSIAQIDQILAQKAVAGNGLISLAHQLIAAKLNVGAVPPASVPASVTTAITAADALIGNKVVPPVGTGFLSPALTSAIETVLDNFNSGIIGPGHCN